MRTKASTDPTTTTTTTPEEAIDSTTTTTKILIIGAGYAGLTLANFLLADNEDQKRKQHQQQRCWHVTIVDQLHPPRSTANTGSTTETSSSGSVIHGSINVPVAKKSVLPQLPGGKAWLESIQSCQHHGCATVKDDGALPEQELLDFLRRQVPVKYLCQVQEFLHGENDHTHSSGTIDETQPPRLYARVLDRSTNNTTTCGPYDWIIVADGALSRFRQYRRRYKNARVLCWIGDAAWVHGRWWDFGYRRLQRGADLAMQQAAQVAKVLLTNSDSKALSESLLEKRAKTDAVPISLINSQPWEPGLSGITPQNRFLTWSNCLRLFVVFPLLAGFWLQFYFVNT